MRYLRFVVHWILLARAASFPMADAVADRIIAAYVDMLVEAGKKAELVAMYSAKLPYDLQLEKMVAFLQGTWGFGQMWAS